MAYGSILAFGVFTCLPGPLRKAVSDDEVFKQHIEMASPLLSVPMGNVTVPQLSRTRGRVECVESMEQEQLIDERRAAKMAHKRLCFEIVERVQRGGSANEFRDLTKRLQKKFGRVVKRHECYLHHADLEEEDLVEEADWLRLVKEDHDEALNSISFLFEN